MLALLRVRRVECSQRLLDAVNDRLREHDQRPDGCDAHGAGADQADALLVDRAGEFLQRHAVRQRARDRVVRHEAGPGDQDADEHREARRNADEVTSADERRRIAERQLRHAAADRNPAGELGAEHLQRVRAECDDAGEDTAHTDLLDTRTVLLIRLIVAADLEDLRSCNALRVSEVAVHDHRAAQRDGEEDTEAAAAGRDEQRLPELEALPVADHQHARDDEDDGRQRARGRCLRLDHVVLEDVRILGHLEDGHRDDSRRDGRREGQSDLESEVYVRCRKDDRQDGTQDHTADRELRQPQLVPHELILFLFHDDYSLSRNYLCAL